MVPKIKNIHRRFMAPTLFTSCNTLPPEGANFPWGDPAENCMAPTLVTSINRHE